MNWKQGNVILLCVIGGASMGFVACGNDEESASDTASTGGTTATAGTSSSTIPSLTRGGASSGIGGVGTTGGGTSTGTGGRATGTGGRASSGGRNSGSGGFAMAGMPAIDLTCIDNADCTSNCTATCPGSTGTSYSCNCRNGQLDCNMAACAASVVGACPSGTTNGSSCANATAMMCTLSSGGTMCLCNTQSDQWTCI